MCGDEGVENDGDFPLWNGALTGSFRATPMGAFAYTMQALCQLCWEARLVPPDGTPLAVQELRQAMA